jgi:hypothetical protein
MGAAAHQRWSDRFSPSRAAAELESVYNAVLQQHAAAESGSVVVTQQVD